MSQPPRLRHLIACPACHRQYDASEVAPGSRFHCDCSELLTVSSARPHESAVVRCSSCGAPRDSGATSCRFCSSDFTIHERDLDTLCPACATRISNRARFCHSCATPIEPQQLAGAPTAHPCPACRESTILHSRPLDGERLSVLECRSCAGLWIDRGVFERLEDRALEREVGWDPLRSGAAPQILEQPASGAPLYRRCPVCDEFMHRANYARRSGVIVDSCHAHGIWFDHGELDALLRWIRSGSLTRAQRQKILDDAEMAAARKAAAGPPEGGQILTRQATFARLLTELIAAVFVR